MTATVRLVVLALACLAGGCLPAGDPPSGQHVIHDRGLTGVFLPWGGAAGGPTRIVASGPVHVVDAAGASGFDLYAFSGSPAEALELSELPPTIAGVVLEDGQAPAEFVPGADDQGRLVYVKATSAPDNPTRVTRFDFGTGQEEDLADPSATQPGFLLSSDGTRLFAGHLLFDADGVTDLSPLSVAQPLFLADDFYYGTVSNGDAGVSGSSIQRSRFGSRPQTLLSSTALVDFLSIPSDVAAQLLVSSVTEAGEAPYLLLDSVRLTGTSIPTQRGQASFESASSDGHWLFFTESMSDGQSRLFFFDWTTANYNAVIAPGIGEADWRPGHHEIWFAVPKGLLSWNPDLVSGATVLDRFPMQVFVASDRRLSMFTRDGSHWFSGEIRQVGNGEEVGVYVGPADDPMANRVPLNPEGQQFKALWEMDDGRLLVGASAFDNERQDLYLVDPKAGSVRPVAGGGHLVALSGTRALALLDWQLPTATGDLTLLDVETGTQTVLAQDVYGVAIANGNGQLADPLASGAPIAFLSRNRLASPYDGLWLARLP